MSESEARPVDLVKDRGARTWAAMDADLDAGRITEVEWFDRYRAVTDDAYLARNNPRLQSGHHGDEARWEGARRPLLAAVDGPGDFLDIGCASGYLMESLRRWAAEDGVDLRPYGLDFSERLIALARSRLPEWADRIWVGNALYWTPPRRFDYIRTSLDYVPTHRRRELVERLLPYCRRLIVGIDNEDVDRREAEEQVVGFGFRIAGRVEVPHPDRRVTRRAVWLDTDGERST